MIALYARLSKADHAQGEDTESLSIEHQLMVLNRHLSTLEEYKGCEVRIFKDDGFSGTNFERPAFEEMMKLARAGKIECIIVKDNSRFGRNYVETGQLIEQELPNLGVRFISVLNGYDSANTLDEDSKNFILGLENILNASYSKNISRNTRAGRLASWKRGDFVSTNVAYGYTYDRNAPGHMVIDEEAASIVRRIFAEVCEGKTLAQVAEGLNKDSVLTSTDYKLSKGQVTGSAGKRNRTGVWLAPVINAIIANETYVGTLIGGKSVSLAFGTNERRRTTTEEQIRIENAHPAIVSVETFQLANSKIQRWKMNGPKAKPVMGLFSGYVFCGTCGKKAVHRRREKNGQKYVAGYVINCSCGNNYEMPSETLKQIVRNTLNHYLALADSLVDELNKTIKSIAEDNEQLQEELATIKIKIDNTCARKLQIYEDYSKEKITKEEYLNLKTQVAARAEALALKRQQLEGKIIELNNLQEKTASSLDSYKDIETARAQTELTKPIIESYIERIEIYTDGTVDIKFKFADLFKGESSICE